MGSKDRWYEYRRGIFGLALKDPAYSAIATPVDGPWMNGSGLLNTDANPRCRSGRRGKAVRA